MTPETGPFRYRADVLVQLARHGVRPTPHTRPDLVREFVRELYKYQIRHLRERMLKRDFPKAEYATRVEALRNQYPVLALLPHQFLDGQAGPAGTISPA